MYKHNPTTPDWLYRPAAIPEEKLLVFSKELYLLYTVTQQKITNIPPNTSCFMMVPDLSKFDLLCPKLNYFLSEVLLLLLIHLEINFIRLFILF